MTSKNDMLTLSKYQQAYREIQTSQAKTGFLINLTACAIVNSILFTINMLLVPNFTWFFFPIVSWGIGLIMHYIFGVRLLHRQLKAEESKAIQKAIGL
jgi:two-component system LytT family sensor kinase